MEKQPAVYMLASGRNGTSPIGATRNLVRRVWQHREHLVEGSTRAHEVTRLALAQPADEMAAAVQREKQLKKWNRNWRIRLTEERDPDWSDLRPGIAGN